MPCYDGSETDRARSSGYDEGYRKGVAVHAEHHPEDKLRISNLQNHAAQLEAVLCALLSELEKRNIASEVISDAEKNGKIGIHDYWIAHSKHDEARLSEKMNRMFSEHEIQVLKSILNK